MEFYEAVRRRRMVRNYSTEPVDVAVIERIVAAARRSPSAGFSQGHSFVVVMDEQLRAAIAGLADEEHYVSAGFDPWISRAPAHVVVCVNEQDYHRRYREADKLDDEGAEIDWPVPFWWVDAGAAMMVVLLAAVAEGLAAGFFGSHRLADLKTLLGIPDEVTPIGIVTIGHPAQDRQSGSLRRGWRPEDEVVHYDGWNPAR